MFNITFFSHARAYHEGSFAALMTDTQLTEYYLEHKFPIYYSQGQGINIAAGCYIFSHMEDQLQSRVRADLRSQFNIDHLVFTVEKQEDYDDIYFFATTPENISMVHHFINNRDIFKHFILYYKDKAASLIKKCPRKKYDTDYFSADFSVPNTSPSFLLNEYQRTKYFESMTINKISLTIDSREIRISRQEIECLKYISKNYTLKEIAKKLNISPRTVESYFNNLKDKFSCNNKLQLASIVDKYNLF